MGKNLSLDPVTVTSNRRGTSFTDDERRVAREATIKVIKEAGGLPTTADGKLAAGLFVAAIRDACKAANVVPAGLEKGRSWGSLAFLAKQIVTALKAEAAKKSKTA